MFFGYNANGAISMCTTSASDIPSSLQTLEVADTDSTAQAARSNLGRYLVTNGTLIAQPFLTLNATGNSASGYTLTAKLNNAPSTPPTEVTFTVLGTQVAAPLTNGTASITVITHPSISGASFSASVGTTGVVGTGCALGTTTPPIALQAVSPTAGTVSIGPAGAGAVAFLQSFYALNNTTVEALLTNAMTGISLLYDAVFNILLPAAQQAAYAPVALDANQTNSVSALKTAILGSLPTTLENGDPSGGTEQMQFGAFVQNFKSAAQNVTNFMEALETFKL